MARRYFLAFKILVKIISPQYIPVALVFSYAFPGFFRISNTGLWAKGTINFEGGNTHRWVERVGSGRRDSARGNIRWGKNRRLNSTWRIYRSVRERKCRTSLKKCGVKGGAEISPSGAVAGLRAISIRDLVIGEWTNQFRARVHREPNQLGALRIPFSHHTERPKHQFFLPPNPLKYQRRTMSIYVS